MWWNVLRFTVIFKISLLQGGSLGKGTALKDKSDVDVVVFINDFHSMDNFRGTMKTKIEKIIRCLSQWQTGNIGNIQAKHHLVTLQLRPSRNEEFIDVDLLPAFDNLEMSKCLKPASSKSCNTNLTA